VVVVVVVDRGDEALGGVVEKNERGGDGPGGLRLVLVPTRVDNAAVTLTRCDDVHEMERRDRACDALTADWSIGRRRRVCTRRATSLGLAGRPWKRACCRHAMQSALAVAIVSNRRRARSVSMRRPNPVRHTIASRVKACASQVVMCEGGSVTCSANSSRSLMLRWYSPR
jgi:hypothetical protein